MASSSAFSVLFVCTGNTCRSPMAEGFLRKCVEEQVPGRVEVRSAGTAGLEGLPASDFARAVVGEDGIDLGSFRSSALEASSIGRADLILTMCPSHREAVLGILPGAGPRTYVLRDFAGTASGPDDSVRDPIGQPIEVYRAVYRQIKDAILAGLPRLLRLARAR